MLQNDKKPAGTNVNQPVEKELPVINPKADKPGLKESIKQHDKAIRNNERVYK